MSRILAINGAYREGGITDRVVDALVKQIEQAGAEAEVILLREYPINFCLNCRECTQQPGEQPGKCVQEDGMQELVEKIERSDGYILAAPTNFGSVTAIFKRFMERLIVYAYWPWGKDYPEFRKPHAKHKRAILVTSCAAPGIMGRLMYDTRKQLKVAARTIGAGTAGTLFTGMMAREHHQQLPAKVHRKINRLAARLLATTGGDTHGAVHH